MCLIVNKNQEFKIAETDIIAYKIVSKFYFNSYDVSPYMETPIVYNIVTNDTNKVFRINNETSSIIKKGVFHLFQNIEDAQKHMQNEFKPDCWMYGETKIIKAIIPKNSKYIEGTFDNLYKSIGAKSVIYQELT